MGDKVKEVILIVSLLFLILPFISATPFAYDYLHEGGTSITNINASNTTINNYYSNNSYNSTYDLWAYNQTTPAINYFNNQINLNWSLFTSGGNLSGGGLAGQIPYFSNSTTLTASANLSFDNTLGELYIKSGSAGSRPSIVLNNTGSTGSPVLFDLYINNVERAYAQFLNGGASAGTFKFFSTDNISFFAGGNNRLHIDKFGNVGIGTTNPLGLLHLQSNGSQLNFGAVNQNVSSSSSFFLGQTYGTGGTYGQINYQGTSYVTPAGQELQPTGALSISGNNANLARGTTIGAGGGNSGLSLFAGGIGLTNEVMLVKANGVIDVDMYKGQDGMNGFNILNNGTGTNSYSSILWGEATSGGKYGYINYGANSYNAGANADAIRPNALTMVGANTGGIGFIAGNANGYMTWNVGGYNATTQERMRLTTTLLTINNNVLVNGTVNSSFYQMYNFNPTSYGIPTGVAMTYTGGIDAGSHQWYLTYVVGGQETVFNQNAYTTSIVAGSEQINLSIPNLYPTGTTEIKVYRTKKTYTSDARQYLLVSLPPTERSYLDNKSDGNLTAQSQGRVWDGVGGVQYLNGVPVMTNNVGITCIGYDACKYASTPANLVAIGGRSGYNSSGLENTFIGYQTGYQATYASYSVAIGTGALGSLTTGFSNMALGRSSLGSVVGGGYNTAVGTSSLQSITSGINNVGIGYLSGGLLTAGAQSNTHIGWQSGGSTGQSAGSIGAICIGANCYNVRNYQQVLGANTILETVIAGNTSIGYNVSYKAQATLDVNGSGMYSGNILPNSTAQWSLGNSTLTWNAYLNNANISGDIIQLGGNSTINNYYSGMHFHNDAGISMTVNQTFMKINLFTDFEYNNGFKHPSTNDTLQLVTSGSTYQVHYAVEGDGTQSHEYESYIYVNENQMNNTYARAIGQASNSVEIRGFGFITLNKWDNITLRMSDRDGVTSGTAYVGNINVLRVGN